MKTIVYDRDFQELEIKPSEVIGTYRQLLAQDVQARLAESRSLSPRACPGCRAEKASPAFEKVGLAYVECDECRSVFVSPCPSDEELAAFYRGSESAHFWRGHLWEQTQGVRLDKVYRPRAEWIVDTVDRYRPEASLWIDVGAASRPMLEELSARKGQTVRIVATNPNANLDCLGAAREGIDVRPTSVSEIATYGPADIVLAFDVLPRVADVDGLFTAARDSLAPGGLMLLDARSASGFDLQVLWENSPNILPPDQLNLLSVEGLTSLFERHGLEALEFSTPGMFDVQNVRRALEDDPQLPCPRIVRYMLLNRDEAALHALQEYLQRYRLSSHARLALRKPQ